MVVWFGCLIMSAKVATLGLLKIKVFSNKGYEVTISVYDVISKNFLRDSNHIVDVVMWPKFVNSSTSMREVRSYVCGSYRGKVQRSEFYNQIDLLFWYKDECLKIRFLHLFSFSRYSHSLFIFKDFAFFMLNYQEISWNKNKPQLVH